MARIKHQNFPLIRVDLDASERFKLESNEEGKFFTADSFEMGEGYGKDGLILHVSGWAVLKDGTEGRQRRDRQISVRDLLAVHNHTELKTGWGLDEHTFGKLVEIVQSAILRWDALPDFIQAYWYETGEADRVGNTFISLSNSPLRVQR